MLRVKVERILHGLVLLGCGRFSRRLRGPLSPEHPGGCLEVCPQRLAKVPEPRLLLRSGSSALGEANLVYLRSKHTDVFVDVLAHSCVSRGSQASQGLLEAFRGSEALHGGLVIQHLVGDGQRLQLLAVRHIAVSHGRHEQLYGLWAIRRL